jgi:DNA-directed RNA polymerase specialized sigma24 family protein
VCDLLETDLRLHSLPRPEQPDAEDFAQEFFRQLMVRGNLFLKARREQGKLRTYVCVAVKRLVTDALRKQERLKRGGAHEIIPFDHADELADPLSVVSQDERFDRQWAKALVERTLTELERDYVARGKGALFTELRPYLGWTENECHL